ncbi:MAG TPA: hypothetical protein VK106_02545 [Balneolaceae bacterium]|nr:hypothetical protein [Balneolaceae bacterium]
MKSKRTKIIVGLVLMAAGGFGSTLDISTQWHYFGNGIVFGVGLTLLGLGLITGKRESKKAVS